MKILVVNDDGIHEDGFKLLIKIAKQLGEVYISAPETHQSGKSQAMTLNAPIKVIDYHDLYGAKKAISVVGTPADALRLGIMHYQDITFDLVLSGVNNGPNIGSDVHHSGTIGAATEALFFNIPAIAISSPRENFSMVERYLLNICKDLIHKKLISTEYVLNINFPSGKFTKPKGIKFSHQGKHYHKAVFRETLDGFIALYAPFDIKEDEESDVYLYKNGYISITPILENRTDKGFFKTLNNKTQLNEIDSYDKI